MLLILYSASSLFQVPDIPSLVIFKSLPLSVFPFRLSQPTPSTPKSFNKTSPIIVAQPIFSPKNTQE